MAKPRVATSSFHNDASDHRESINSRSIFQASVLVQNDASKHREAINSLTSSQASVSIRHDTSEHREAINFRIIFQASAFARRDTSENKKATLQTHIWSDTFAVSEAERRLVRVFLPLDRTSVGPIKIGPKRYHLEFQEGSSGVSITPTQKTTSSLNKHKNP
ncbi:Uncharacterized protein Fot_11787 [Forsythia ovata]|uniref:Uncharacterized protein n=1 Tax=Forsythia ovata TaxID=205694 RepID=A0ABD1WKN7_9LAMI